MFVALSGNEDEKLIFTFEMDTAQHLTKFT